MIVLYLPYGVGNGGVSVLSKLEDFRENIGQKNKRKTDDIKFSQLVPVSLTPLRAFRVFKLKYDCFTMLYFFCCTPK